MASLLVAPLLLSALSGALAKDWPPPITPVWPVRWASLNYSGDFPIGPDPWGQVTLNGSWYFSWPTNQWRQDTCVRMKPGAPSSCKVELWSGNDKRANSSYVGTTYTFTEAGCTYGPAVVP